MGIADTLNANSTPTKTQVKDCFKQLEKHGWTMFTANSNRKVSPGMKYFPDHHLFGHKKVIYIEVKIGRDVLTEGQLEVQRRLVDLMVALDFKTVYYFLADETDYQLIRDKILRSKDLSAFAGCHFRSKLRVKN